MAARTHVSISRFVIALCVACALSMMVLGAPETAMAVEQDSAAQGLSLKTQESDSVFESPDGLVVVDGITAGKVSYNASTKTLTLNGVKADMVGIKKDGKITLNLVGSNSLEVVDNFRLERQVTHYEDYGEGSGYEWEETVYDNYDCVGSVVVSGSGALKGHMSIMGSLAINGGKTTLRSINCTSLAMSKGTLVVRHGIDCRKNLTISGGTLSAANVDVAAISCTALSVTGGALSATGMYSSAISCTALSVKGGTLSGTSEYSNAISCSTLTVKGGKVKASTKDRYSRSISCKSLSMSKGTLSAPDGIECSKNLTLKGGVLSTTDGVKCSKNLTVKGGTFSATSKDSTAVYCAALTVKGGKVKATTKGQSSRAISCTSLAMSKGSLTATGGIACSKNLTVKGGKIRASVPLKASYPEAISCKTFTMTKGSIAIPKARTGIDCSGTFILRGGAINIKRSDTGIEVGNYGIHKTRTMTIKGGKIAIYSPSNYGIRLYSSNLAMTGGTVMVSKSYGSGIRVDSKTYRGKTYGGKVKLTGGTVISTTRKGKYGYGNAISADSMSNKSKCLKKIVGSLPKGATFKVDGNVYKSADYGVLLVKYGANTTTPTFNEVRYGGERYYLSGIASNAFNTKAGQRVSEIKFDRRDPGSYIGKNAFSNTKSLEKLHFGEGLPINEKYSSDGRISVEWRKYAPISETAFSNCGKDGGSGLTLVLYEDGIGDPDTVDAYKQLFVSKGMSSDVAIKVRDGNW